LNTASSALSAATTGGARKIALSSDEILKSNEETWSSSFFRMPQPKTITETIAHGIHATNVSRTVYLRVVVVDRSSRTATPDAPVATGATSPPLGANTPSRPPSLVASIGFASTAGSSSWSNRHRVFGCQNRRRISIDTIDASEAAISTIPNPPVLLTIN
jgi:hypothetical protein